MQKLVDWLNKQFGRMFSKKVSKLLVEKIWLIFSYNQQSHVHDVIKKLSNKCRPIIVSIFGNVLIAKIILNPKRENVVFIVLMEMLSVLQFRKERTVKRKKYLYDRTHHYIVCCIVIPLALLGIPFIYSKRTKKRKAWEEEREKIKDE